MKRLILLSAVILTCLLGIDAYAEYELWRGTMGGVIFIGDSYCEGVNANNDNQSIPKSSWAYVVADSLTLENYAISCKSGAGFAAKKNGSNFTSLLEQAKDSFADLESVGWIVVLGGNDDLGESSEAILQGGLAFAESAHTLYPNAKIVLAMAGCDTIRADRLNQLAGSTAPAWRAIAENVDAYYIDEIELVLNQDGVMSNDGYHPNWQGQEVLGGIVEGFLRERYAEAIEQHDEALNQQQLEYNAKHQEAINRTIMFGAGGAILLILLVIFVRYKTKN